MKSLKVIVAACVTAAAMSSVMNVCAEEKASVITDFKPQAQTVTSEQGFVHPGIGFSADDLNRIQTMVREGYEPYASAFDAYRTNPKALKSYKPQGLDENGNPKYQVVGDGNGQYEIRADADAAFAQTMMWYITGDSDYSNKALEIIRSWYIVREPYMEMLTAGMSTQKLCAAAEIMRYTPDSGWTDEDTEMFTAFVNAFKVGTDRPTAFMNQGSIATMGYMSAAVFTNDMESYKKAIKRTTTGEESEAPNRDYSIKRQIREQDGLFYLAEMGRDQGHAQGDIGALSSLAQTAYIQNTLVDEDGNITPDGTTIYEFMDNRLLKGAAAAARYNLGYDFPYPATDVGTVDRPETYEDVSSIGRGQISAVYACLYNHYRYVQNISDDDEYLKYIKEVIDYNKIETVSTDFFGSGTLLYTLKPTDEAPKGEPKEITIPNYENNTAEFGRIQAASFKGTAGDHTGTIGVENYEDAFGQRQVISGIKENFYAWYTDIEFDHATKMAVSAASSSTDGCCMDVILLDNVEGIDYNAVTNEDLEKGEKIGEIHLVATGWWANYSVNVGSLTREIDGKHNIALKFHGSDNVYRYQANVDYFKFISRYANDGTAEDRNIFKPVTPATVSLVENGTKTASAVVLNGGEASFIMPDIDFKSGVETLALTVKSDSAAKIAIHTMNAGSSFKEEPFAEFDIPATNGEYVTVYCDFDKTSSGGMLKFAVTSESGLEFTMMQMNPQKPLAEGEISFEEFLAGKEMQRQVASQVIAREFEEVFCDEAYKNIQIKDGDTIEEKYKDGVLKNYYLGIFEGDDDGSFRPLDLLSDTERNILKERLGL